MENQTAPRPRAADFKKHLDTEFTIFREEGRPFAARLASVEEQARNPELESFAVVYLLPKEYGIVQETCRVEHPSMGAHYALLVPIGQTADAYRYESVFCYLREES